MKKLLLGILLSIIALPAFPFSYVLGKGYLVSAGGAGWSTDWVFVYPYDTIQAGLTTFKYPDMAFKKSNCGIGFHGNSFTVEARSSKRIENVENHQCQQFTVVEQEYAFVTATSLLTYKNGNEFAYLSVPALVPALEKEKDSIELSGIINDGEVNTDLAIFNLDTTTLLSVNVLNDKYELIAVETIVAQNGLTFTRLQTKIEIGAIQIVQGYTQTIGFPHEPFNSRILGFAIVGKVGAPKVIPFREF